ncbi:MAG: hypothetical protein KF906_03895 [Actinobacteria bacterium]|nr:hypothetical protein [Actinomycetota bacterium]
MRTGPQSDRRWPGRWWWVLLALTVLPIIGSGIQRTADGWYPESDDATITLLGGDVFSSDVPLVGMISTGGDGLDDPELHHPGPLELYMLAPFVALPGSPVPATTVAVVLLAVLAVAVVGLALRRVGGELAGVLGLVAAGFAVWGVGGDVPASVWNPDVVALPFAALVASTAAVAAGHRRWLIVQLVLASFVAQTHLSYVGLVGVLVLWSLAVTARDLVRSEGADRTDRLRWLGVAAGVTFVLWLPPLVQQVTGSPGNLGQIVRSITGPGGDPVGAAGLTDLARVVGLPLVGAAPAGDLVVGVEQPSALDIARLLVPFVIGVALVVAAHRRRDGVARRLAATALVTLVAGVVTATRMPLADGILYRYYGRWMWPLGALVWLLFAVAALRLAPARWMTAPPARFAPPALAAVALVVALLPRPGAWEPWQVQRRAAGDVVDRAAAVVQESGAEHVVVRFRGGTAFLSTGSAVALAVEQRGIPTTMDAGAPLDVLPWGDQRAPDRTPADATALWVVSGPDPVDLPTSARLVSRAVLLSDTERAEVQRSADEWRERIATDGIAIGDRTADATDVRERVDAALDDPVAAFDRGELGDLAARGLVEVPGGSVDDLYTLDRLRSQAEEDTVRVYLVTPS